MNKDLIYARRLLAEGNYTCVLCKGHDVRCCTARGVRPLFDLLKESRLADYSAADKVIGKATAFLYVLLGVRAVYAPVVSESAIQVLRNHGIEVSCDVTVPAIFNRAGTGYCPMETAVWDLDDPEAALKAIETTLYKMHHRQ